MTTQVADVVFFGAHFVTMDRKQPEVEALAAKNGRIVAVGKRDDVEAWVGSDTRVVELDGVTVLPGLIEPHTHPVASALLYDWVDVSGITYPDKNDVMRKIRDAAANLERGEWLCCFGFDSILTPGLEALNRQILDEIAPNNPAFVMIQSMHTAYVNSQALEAAGVTKDTPDPSGGGRFDRDEHGELTGRVLEPTALMPFMAAMPLRTREEAERLVAHQVERYARVGITTIGICGIVPLLPDADGLVRRAAQSDDAVARVRLYHTLYELQAGVGAKSDDGDARFRCIGAKIWHDGSPYSGTMLLDEPYRCSHLMQEGLGVPKGTCGHRNYTPEELAAFIREYHDAGLQVAIHAQGDQANRDAVDGYAAALEATPRTDHRHRCEHCALYPPDLMARAAELGVTLSFHVNHIYYYGEALRDDILGPERMQHFMPVASAKRAGVRFSLHADSPMYPALPLTLVRTAVTRKTRNGAVIAPDEAISVEDALRAVTIDAAWQLFSEAEVGSLEVGKYADLTVLAEDPRRVDPDTIDQIEVIGTYLAGRRVEMKTNS